MDASTSTATAARAAAVGEKIEVGVDRWMRAWARASAAKEDAWTSGAVAIRVNGRSR